MPPDDPQASAAAMRAEQARRHGQAMPWMPIGSAALAGILAWGPGQQLDGHWPIAWLAALATALVLHAAIGIAQRRRGAADPAHPRWRRWHRLAFALHGLVWALGGALLFLHTGSARPELVSLALVALVALIALALLDTRFDRVAAGAVVLPAREEAAPQADPEPDKSEAALRIYEIVTNSTADMISVVDENEAYLMVNDAWCRGLGLQRSAVLGRTPVEVMPSLMQQPERRRAIRDAIERRSTSVVHSTTSLIGIGPRRLESTYFPYAEDADSVGRGVIIITRDVTSAEQDRAALQASSAMQHALLDAFPGMIAVADGQDRCTYINQRLAALFGHRPQDLIGKPVAAMLEPSKVAGVTQAIARARRDGRSLVESHYPATDTRPGVDLEVEHIAGVPLLDGSVPVFTFGNDVTERNRVQAALEVALAQAERANAAKSMFLSSMSHELRTPMNAILGFGQLLETDQEQPLSTRQRNFVAEILRGGQHLLALINDLLDLGSIEAGELKTDCRLLPLRPLVDDCIALVAPLAQARAVTLTHAPDAAEREARVWADPKRLRQVLLNLLSNAIKYNQAGGRVEVSLVEKDSWLEIRVADTGPGLSPEQQERLFKPFERLEARHGTIEGSGIGLALSRRLVEAMDGEVGLDSEPGRGSLFRVRLRRPALAAAQMPEPAAHPAPAVQVDAVRPLNRTALYIEDNPINVMLMQAMLEGLLQLVVELEPLAGLRTAQSLRPDIVLLDLQLPGIDGFEVLRRLRADPRTQRIPVVAVSANAMPATASAGEAAGFAAYLTKPLEIELLHSTLRRVLADGAG